MLISVTTLVIILVAHFVCGVATYLLIGGEHCFDRVWYSICWPGALMAFGTKWIKEYFKKKG